ncbi:MAG: hypothetical protein H5T59_00685 [Anaerolineae bacterium]|nr:hypothetical protein [Anaerolineae bacterium]
MGGSARHERGALARALGTEGLVWGVVFLALFAMAARVPLSPDLWWHLAAGRAMAEGGQVLRADIFSHTVAGKPWTDVYWLAQLAMYGLYRLGGLSALMVATALTVVLAFVPLARVLRGNLFVRAFALTLAAVVSAVTWVPRPQLATFAFLSLTLWLLGHQRRDRASRAHWALVPLFALWANLHGGFPAGTILIACVLAGDALERALRWATPETLPWRRMGDLALAGLAALGATCLNPHTYRVLLLPFQTVGMEVLRTLIQEWASPDFHRPEVLPFLVLLLATALAWGLSPRRPALRDLMGVSAFAYLALLAGRNISLAALVMAPTLAEHGTLAWERLRAAPRFANLRWPDAASPPRPALNAAVLGVLLVAAAGKAAYVATVTEEAVRGTYPVDALAFIRAERPPREMFNPYQWGGFCIWALHPDYPVFVDGRTDLYDDPFLREYLQVAWAQPGWQAVLDRHNVRFALVEAGSLLDRWLEWEPGWEAAYRDSLAAVWVRQGAGGAAP